MKDCLFCKIINKEIPADIIYEDDEVLAFNDIHPLAPMHVLIIPKKHIGSINDLQEDDSELVGKMILIAKKLAKDKGIDKDGYKLLFRTGKHGGQEVPHIHLHLIGGAQLKEGIGPV
ncbi:MAG: histidine triad nucleotide-binding protein [Candidatus Moranbacteria bacterium]|jgi:histidine triad (HIT) family protein|nr:histidine triad nucleotide-binding protein [Candidatus Moranbacteria bacterium]MDD5651939.1 histidine triad nucleotide-binding protein [Candidatus Moranbacteria bacterium]MDX9855985.1 histidine triad nucleotide-binding protein [Candidatus Moranbacteria bacterium]